jgi:hypothetical protein
MMLTDAQQGVVGRRQAFKSGVSRYTVRRRLRAGKWQRMHRGVYQTFTGEPKREAELWAAVCRAGTGAMLSHETAAELHGLIDDAGAVIHITVPSRRRPAQRKKIQGVVIHRSDQSQAQTLPAWKLPRTRIEDTVLDLVAAAHTFDDAYAWISRAVTRRLTTPGAIRKALSARKRIRWRAWLSEAVAEVSEGVHFPLELRFVRDVERAHGIPAARRQARRQHGYRTRYIDNLYGKYRVCVELDGNATHTGERRLRDSRRDNDNLAENDTETLRFGWVDVTEYRCKSAGQLAAVLIRRGWSGDSLHPCGSSCPVRRG